METKIAQKICLVDVDGTICEDIKNEDSHLYATAKVIEGAKEVINKWYDNGDNITFFTARESKDRDITLKWLDDNGFKYHGLIMDKPRCLNENSEYVWVDNRKVRGVTFKGIWSELVKISKEINIFKES
jgi:uncharacterized HAD superfamily protein